MYALRVAWRGWLMMATAMVVLGMELALHTLVLVGVGGLLAVVLHDLFDHELDMSGNGLLRYFIVLVGFPVLYWLVGMLNLPVAAWFLMWLEAFVVLYLVHYMLPAGDPRPHPAHVH